MAGGWRGCIRDYLLPFAGAALGLAFYFVIRGRVFPSQVTVQQTSPFGLVALASLVGMFS